MLSVNNSDLNKEHCGTSYVTVVCSETLFYET